VNELSPWRIAKALDEIARAAAYLHSSGDGSGLNEVEIGTLNANISLRTLETVLAMFKEQAKNGPKPWDEEIPDLPANLREHWPG
jgi:hypothetical protein